MNTTEYFDCPTITRMEDIGDDDCCDWIAHAAYKDQTAEFASRDYFKASEGAIAAVINKVVALEVLTGTKTYPCPKHPEVLREHELQICHKCEAEIDADMMHTISEPFLPVRPDVSLTPDTDHDFFEME